MYISSAKQEEFLKITKANENFELTLTLLTHCD